MIDYQHLEYLLERFSFEELDADQQNWVLQELSASEYQQLRDTLLHSQGYFELQSSTESTPPQPPQQLQEAFKNRYGKQDTFWKQILMYKIPSYQVAALLTAVIALVWFFGRTTQTQTERIIVSVPQVQYKTKVLTQIDTIYQERIVYKTIKVPQAPLPNIKVDTAKNLQQTPPIFANSSTKKDTLKILKLQEIDPIFAKTQFALDKPKGSKLSAHEDLMDFVVKLD
ncbi:MAG: hypothetical protein MK212_16155 [Saprospiraceae bacterium]|nr:hypothetical protein [Saprospiraceae bacterium]